MSILIAKPEGKRSRGNSRSRWEDNIITDLTEKGWMSVTGFIWLRIGTSNGFL
jgi:hypothetical protein